MMARRFLLVLVACLLPLISCIRTSEEGKTKYEYDVVIIGSGPGGLTAGIYTSRGNLETLVIEGDMPGGLITETPSIENWPGEEEISGYDLMEKMRKHARHSGCTLLSDKVKSVDFSQCPYQLITTGGATYSAKAVIVATGAKRKKLGVPGEAEYWGKGISACATCDAPFYTDKTVVVAGAGRTALTEAQHLSRFAKKVIMIHRSATLKETDPIRRRVENNPKIEVVHNGLIQEITGEKNDVNGIVVKDRLSGEVTTIKTDGVFVAIGFLPNVAIFDGQLELNELGYIDVRDQTKTSKEGVFAAGDVTHRKYQQVVVAAGDGCKAAIDCEDYLSSVE